MIWTPSRQPYHGLDFGFANDPTAGWSAVDSRTPPVHRARGSQDRDWNWTRHSGYVSGCIPGIEDHVIRSRQLCGSESISYLMRRRLPRITACRKWAGSGRQDRVASSLSAGNHHPSALQAMAARGKALQLLQVDRLTGEVSPDVVDAHGSTCGMPSAMPWATRSPEPWHPTSIKLRLRLMKALPSNIRVCDLFPWEKVRTLRRKT